jgi:integral membrane protein
MLKSLTTSIGRFRLIALTEGVSFLILLFIAMPMKYLWHNPSAVRTVGSIHGALFVLYVLYYTTELLKM